MADNSTQLRGCRVLVLEDEYFLANDLELTLRRHGAEVIGPIGDPRQAFDILIAGEFDVVTMNVALQNQKTYNFADELTQRQIPFMFLTGFSAKAIPARFRHVKVRGKPCAVQHIANEVAQLCRQSAKRRWDV